VPLISHRSSLSPAPCIAALLLLLSGAAISSDAGFATLRSLRERERREAHLEPADEAGYRTYTILLEEPAGSQDMDAVMPMLTEHGTSRSCRRQPRPSASLGCGGRTATSSTASLRG
jgi:hypothetical protein